MDPVSLAISIVTIVGVLVGIFAGVVQVIEYLEKRRNKNKQESANKVEKSSSVTPYNLPRKTTLIGRNEDIRRLSEIIQSDTQIVVIEGLGGIGKTALAANLANQWFELRLFPQVIWVSAKKRDLTLAGVINEIVIAIDFPYISQLPLHRQTIEVSRLLRQTPHLLVIDNFETVEKVAKEEIFAFLLSLPHPTKALITSRPTLVGEDPIPSGSSIYKLDGLDLKHSLSLINRESQRIGITINQKGSDHLFSELYSITGGNPLAIILAIGQVRHGKNSLEMVIANIRKAKGNVFQEIFGSTWLLLSDQSPSLLMASSLFVSSFSKDALFSTQASITPTLDTALSQLLQFSLIESNNALTDDELRFEIHPLTRAFAESKLDDTNEKREEFSVGLAQYYLQLSQRYEVRFWEGRDVYGPLEKERLNILSIMDWAWKSTRYACYAKLAKSIADFLNVRGDWQLCMSYGEQAIKAAEIIGNKDLQAWLMVHMHGYLYASRYEFDKAKHILIQAIDLYRATQNKLGISETLRNLARVYRKNNEIEQAEMSAHESYKIALETKDNKLISVALNELGKLSRDKGKLPESMLLFQEAIKYLGSTDNSIYAGILCNMAGVALDIGDVENAEIYSRESLNFFLSIDNKEGLATTKWRLAEIELTRNIAQAEIYAKDAYDIFNRLGMQKECIELQNILGNITQIRGRTER